MKQTLKKMFSVMLVLATVFCSVASLDFSAVAADYSDDNVFETTAPVTEDFEETTIVVEPTEFSTEASQVTEPTDVTEPSTVVTEPVTEPTEPTTQKPAPVVGTVKNLKNTKNEVTSISLSWSKVSGATGYYVYVMNTEKDSKYKKVATVKTNTYTVKNLTQASPYNLKVSAYVVQDGVKYEGKGAVKTTATRPEAVSKIKLVESSKKQIKISWTKNAKVTGYKIYRACSDTNGKFVHYKTIGKASTVSFTDKNVKGNKAYYYRVRTYRTLNNGKNTYHGADTEMKSVCGLEVTDFSMTSQLNRVSFSWKKNSYAKGYEIYYSTSKDGKYTRLGYTSKLFYNTEKLTHNKTYYFRIRPYKQVGKNKTKVVGTFVTKSKKVTKLAYKQDVGSTYIEISLKQQHMWFYYKGKLYCETDVVTGNDDGYHNTPKGVHKIWQRQSPATLVGPGYSTPVDYWMAFTYQGHGIHDSTWRPSSDYGGTTYKGNGSHGCVNTPYSAVKKIYSKARIGYEVVIY